METRSASDGIKQKTESCKAICWIAALLSQYQRNRQRCFSPQNLDKETIIRRVKATPQSSQRVDNPVSYGPSTGPEHLKRTCFFMDISHPFHDVCEGLRPRPREGVIESEKPATPGDQWQPVQANLRVGDAAREDF
jgi:hypothetical protein